MKKYISISLCIIFIFAFSACSKKAEPIALPNPADIYSVNVTVEQNTVNTTDKALISELISGISNSKPTRKQSVQDSPNVQNYIKIDFEFENGTSTLFAYENGGKYYVEQPYQGIYLIDSQFYKNLQNAK